MPSASTVLDIMNNKINYVELMSKCGQPVGSAAHNKLVADCL